MKHAPVRHRVPPELIEEYEQERTEVRFEPGDLENAKEPETVTDAAEYILLDSDVQREASAERASQVAFELHQTRGTKMLYVVEVSDDGNTVRYRSSDGTYGVQQGQPVG